MKKGHAHLTVGTESGAFLPSVVTEFLSVLLSSPKADLQWLAWPTYRPWKQARQIRPGKKTTEQSRTSITKSQSPAAWPRLQCPLPTLTEMKMLRAHEARTHRVLKSLLPTQARESHVPSFLFGFSCNLNVT